MEAIIAFLTTFIVNFIGHTGYGGIFVLMTLESALVPIPSEVTMPFSGYLVSTGRFGFWEVVFIGAFANLFGSVLVYSLGHWGEETLAHQLVSKYGKYLLISKHELERSEKWFRDHGEKITFFSRVLPIVRTFISLPAGIAHMNFKKFVILTFLGSLIWSAVLTYIGLTLGNNWNTIHHYYQKFEYVVIGAIIFGVIYFIWHKVKGLHK